ncbi:MAG: hypothetical protein Q7S08_02345 [bacterium]|nr:hypothetical protein [bacterium]
MENNIQKSTVVFSLAIIALALFVVWQQQEISQIRNGQISKTSSEKEVASQNQPAFNQAQAIKDSLLATRTISGTVVSSTASEVVIKTSLVNLSALDTFDFKKSQTLPASVRNLTATITKDTVVSGGTLVVGGLVSIQTKEPVYGGGALTAVSINISVPSKALGVPPVPK